MKKFLQSFSFKTILLSEKPTFHHNNLTSESQIDHIYVFIPEKSSVRISLQDHLCLKDNPTNLSSHDVIVGKVVLPTYEENVSSRDFSSSYSEFLVKKPKWNESCKDGYQIQSARILQELYANYNDIEHIPALCEMFSKALVISAEKNFETTIPNQKNTDYLMKNINKSVQIGGKLEDLQTLHIQQKLLFYHLEEISRELAGMKKLSSQSLYTMI